jgi:protein phosphatase
MRLLSYGLSDVGRKRPHNEDAWLCDDQMGLYVVADGVGGHAKGEVASQESIEQVQNWVRAGKDRIEAFRSNPESEDFGYQVRRLVESAVQQACYMVFGMAELDPERKGMSTTISALLVSGPSAFIAQVGDSRVYLMREGEVQQLTEDHTLINYKLKHGLITEEEARKAPGKNVITRAVGHRDYVEVDTTRVQITPGDRFMLCTDGLHGYLQDKEISPLLSLEPMQDAARQFIALANARGGRDNITTVIVSVGE